MPTYAYYPQGPVLSGVAVEARHEDDEAAMTHAAQVMSDYPNAHEVSVWCDERYVGRQPIPTPVAQPKPAGALASGPEGATSAPAKRPRRPRRGGSAKA